MICGKVPESKCPLRHHSHEWASYFTSQALCLSGLWKITSTKWFSQSLEHSGCSVLVLGPAGYKQTSVFYELFALSPLKYFKANTLWAERTPISSLPSSIMIEALGYLQMKITFLDSWSQVWPQLGFPCDSAGKESVCNERDLGSIPGEGRSPGEGKGYLLQYSGLANSMDCIVHGVAKSQTWLSDFHFTSLATVHLWIWVRSDPCKCQVWPLKGIGPAPPFSPFFCCLGCSHVDESQTAV